MQQAPVYYAPAMPAYAPQPQFQKQSEEFNGVNIKVHKPSVDSAPNSINAPYTYSYAPVYDYAAPSYYPQPYIPAPAAQPLPAQPSAAPSNEPALPEQEPAAPALQEMPQTEPAQVPASVISAEPSVESQEVVQPTKPETAQTA